MTSIEIPAAERECPRCGSPAGSLQEYCLECGARLPPSGGGPQHRPGGLLTVLVTAFVAFAAAGIMVGIQLTTDEERSTLVATLETQSTPVTTAEPVPTETVPTVTEPTTTTPPPPPPPRNQIVEWPQGTRGWTVVLNSIPAGQGRAGATAQARDASEAGLAEVGVLRSDAFSSLHPGYFVVFSGIFDTRAQAEQGAAAARNRGYDAAYAREIAP